MRFYACIASCQFYQLIATCCQETYQFHQVPTSLVKSGLLQLVTRRVVTTCWNNLQQACGWQILTINWQKVCWQLATDLSSSSCHTTGLLQFLRFWLCIQAWKHRRCRKVIARWNGNLYNTFVLGKRGVNLARGLYWTRYTLCRFPSVFTPLDPEFVGKECVDGMLRNKSRILVPKSLTMQTLIQT